MCKKFIVAAVAILVGTAVVKHTSIGSLAQVWWQDAKQAVERQVPPEVQLKRLNNEIGKIDADIKHKLGRLAQQEVDVEKLDGDIASLREQQATLKADITAMTKKLDDSVEPVKLDRLAAIRTTRKLDASVRTYERRKAEMKTKESLLATKREALQAAHDRISEMASQKDQLRITVEELNSKLQIARLNATRENQDIEFDDSQVAKCKQLANEIAERLKVAEHEANLNSKFGYTNPVPKVDDTTKPTADVLKAAKKAIEDDSDQQVAKDRQ